MINQHHYRLTVFLVALALVGAAGTLHPQASVPSPKRLPVITDHKVAEGLVVAQPAPEYPPVAKINYIQGQVLLELVVSGMGKVARAHVLEGDALLAASALEATARWVYKPLVTPSGPSGFITTVKLKFSLKDNDAVVAPQRAEKDFLRQVKPPQIVQSPDEGHLGDVVHMRILVNEEGQAVDVQGSPADGQQLEALRASLRHWSFRPAYWGSLPVPSYVEVDRSR